MNGEWIVRSVIAIVSYSLGARGKAAAREKAAWEGLEVGVKLGAEATKQKIENEMLKRASGERRW